uniref:Uncharacterized protein n=1 Tax=Brassica campestris TaxID=3711 RepID=A0A3P6BWI2_BRACM|nr:unnamed protein product [Brassica rapa]
MLQGQYGFGQAHQLEEALSHKAEAHNLFPMRQLVLTLSTLILADRYLHLFDSLTLIRVLFLFEGLTLTLLEAVEIGSQIKLRIIVPLLLGNVLVIGGHAVVMFSSIFPRRISS